MIESCDASRRDTECRIQSDRPTQLGLVSPANERWFVIVLSSAIPSEESAHNHRRPIRHRHERPGNQSDTLERLLLDVELPVKPIEPNIEASGGFEQETGTGVEPEPQRPEIRRYNNDVD